MDSALEETKICQYCKMSVPSDASVCGHCGQGISAVHTASAVIGLIIGLCGAYAMWQWWSTYSSAAALVK